MVRGTAAVVLGALALTSVLGHYAVPDVPTHEPTRTYRTGTTKPTYPVHTTRKPRDEHTTKPDERTYPTYTTAKPRDERTTMAPKRTYATYTTAKPRDERTTMAPKRTYPTSTTAKPRDERTTMAPKRTYATYTTAKPRDERTTMAPKRTYPTYTTAKPRDERTTKPHRPDVEHHCFLKYQVCCHKKYACGYDKVKHRVAKTCRKEVCDLKPVTHTERKCEKKTGYRYSDACDERTKKAGKCRKERYTYEHCDDHVKYEKKKVCKHVEYDCSYDEYKKVPRYCTKTECGPYKYGSADGYRYH